MFTAEQGDFWVQYYDPESGRIRKYYPDFFAGMTDGTYQLIEVKGDNMIDDPVVTNYFWGELEHKLFIRTIITHLAMDSLKA